MCSLWLYKISTLQGFDILYFILDRSNHKLIGKNQWKFVNTTKIIIQPAGQKFFSYKFVKFLDAYSLDST